MASTVGRRTLRMREAYTKNGANDSNDPNASNDSSGRECERRADTSQGRFIQRDRALIQLREIAADGETEPGPRGLLVSPHAALQNPLSHLRRQPGSIVVYGDHQRVAPPFGCDDDVRASPLAGVVEQIAEHFVEVFALRAYAVRRVHADVDRQL